MQRIVIIGTSCSGKSTLGKHIGEKLGFPHTELDSLHWLPGWKTRSKEEFREKVQQTTAAPQWVIDGNYSTARDIVWSRADTIIWLNYRFSLVLYRALKRTITRLINREKVCNGNVESFRQSFFSRDSILLWVLHTYARNKRNYTTILRQPEYAGHRVIELNSPKQTQNFVHSLSA